MWAAKIVALASEKCDTTQAQFQLNEEKIEPNIAEMLLEHLNDGTNDNDSDYFLDGWRFFSKPSQNGLLNLQKRERLVA